MNPHIQAIQQEILATKSQIVNHRLYSQTNNINHIHTFMQHHVFAVWDFMSLLKTLQQNLTCVNTPWIPVGEANTRFLINEIVVGEESDINEIGERKSHFEMYLDAMKQCGANTSQIETFIHEIKRGQSVSQALDSTEANDAIQSFVNFTFTIIQSGKPHVQAAVFTFGREDLIPDMFIEMVRDLHTQFPEKISKFKYYLERHIEVDGDHHSHLALEMTASLCGNDDTKWQEAKEASLQALAHRLALWNSISASIAINAIQPV